MAIDTIKASAILDGAIDTADIADDAVTSAKLDTNIAIDGTLTVASQGKIGVATSPYFASPDWGVKVGQSGAQGYLEPTNQFGSALDADINMGAAGTRWKNLYLSGGVYLGGTGAANYLDDYETGTFTPTWSNLTLGNASVNTGYYLKVGKLVNVHFSLVLGSTTSIGGSVNMTNLPFAVNRRHYGGGHVENTSVDTWAARGRATEGTTNCNIQIWASNSTYSQIRGLSATAPFTWGNGDTIVIDVTYQTT
jgi:hypothetical protein